MYACDVRIIRVRVSVLQNDLCAAARLNHTLSRKFMRHHHAGWRSDMSFVLSVAMIKQFGIPPIHGTGWGGGGS